MNAIVRWFGLGFLLLLGCSPRMLSVERPTADGYLKVVALSHEHQVRRQSQVKMPHAITGKSDIVVRHSRIYVGSYKRLYLIEQDSSGVLHVVSSVRIEGYDVSLALHPQDDVIYIANSEGIWVVDAKEFTNPKLVRHLLLADELENNLIGVGIEQPIATDIACEDGKLVITIQGVGQSQTSSRAGTTLVFDVSNPLIPQSEQVLDSLSGASAIAMGLFNHQMFVAGDRVIEYQDQEKLVDEWLRKPGLQKHAERLKMPGRVVDLKFIMGPRDEAENSEKLKARMEQYRRADASQRQLLQNLVPFDQGVLYIATEHAATYMDTSFKVVLWGPNSKNEYVSDYFGSIYGMDARGYSYVYLATGAEGISILKRQPKYRRLRTQARYNDLPSPALDVYVTDDQLYILCGELSLENVKHNELIKTR